MKMLFGYIKKNKLLMFFGPLFKLLESIAQLLSPILVARLIDEGIASASSGVIIKYALMLVIVTVMGLVFSIAGQKCASLISTKISAAMRFDLFKKISSLSHAELDKFGTASLVNRLTNDTNQIENAIGIFVRAFIRAPLLLIGAFVLSLVINIKMSLIFLVLIPIVVVLLVVYTKKTNPYFLQIRTKLDRISKVTKENLSGVRVIRAFNKQEDEQKRFESVSADYTKTTLKVSKISSLIDPVVFLIVDLGTIALLAVGGWQINIGGMTQGDIIALIDYITILTLSLLMISRIITIVIRAVASLRRIDSVLKTDPSVKEPENAKFWNKLEYDALLEFKDVCFNYSLNINEKSFIKNLSFKLYPGQTLGIIGGTGSGKTTIANLMTRFYDVTQGEVLYKGKNVKDFSLEQLRHEISVVQQRSTLFGGSLRENMQLRKNDATDEEIIEALKISQAWPFVSEWKNGLKYQIMAGGKNVSGGQMQRLTIARALIDNPELLILDDSSSALDFLTDSKLRKAIKNLNTTTVYISQRATSIKGADLIIVLDNGDVVGMGKHNDLMKNCEIYREIYESQSK